MNLKDQVSILIKSMELGRTLKREMVILTIGYDKGVSIIPCSTQARAEQLMISKDKSVKYSLYPTSKWSRKKLEEKYGVTETS